MMFLVASLFSFVHAARTGWTTPPPPNVRSGSDRNVRCQDPQAGCLPRSAPDSRKLGPDRRDARRAAAVLQRGQVGTHRLLLEDGQEHHALRTVQGADGVPPGPSGDGGMPGGHPAGNAQAARRSLPALISPREERGEARLPEIQGEGVLQQHLCHLRRQGQGRRAAGSVLRRAEDTTQVRDPAS